MAQVEQSTSTGGNLFKTTLTDNFQYNSSVLNFYGDGATHSAPFFLGFGYDDGLAATFASRLEFNVYIPSNFVIEDATITIVHTPVYWDNGGDYAFWGYSRKLKAYKVNDSNNFLVGAAFFSEYMVDSSSITEIYGALGDSGFTPQVPTAADYRTTTKISNNIKDSLVAGNNIIIVQSSDTLPTYSGDFVTDVTSCGKKTGYAYGILNVMGHYS